MNCKRITGLTLVELMIALAISAILLAGVSTVYFGNRKAAALNEGIARVQENLRFASELLAQDIRMAGYVGCKTDNITNALNNPTLPHLDINTPLRGFEGDTSISGFPTEISNSGNPPQQRAVVGSDALIVLRGGGAEFNIVNHAAPASGTGPGGGPASMQMDRDVSGILASGDIVVVSDCRHSAALQITAQVAGGSDTFTFNTGSSVSPGNCWKLLGPVDPDSPASCGGLNGVAHNFGGGKLLTMQSHLYYVATSVSGQTTSLYRLSLNNGTLSVREELAEGVENMQVLYGIDGPDTDQVPDRYVTANNVTDWSTVNSVRIGMLIASEKAVRSTDDNKTYTVAGTDIGNTSTTVTHPGDKKIRFTYSMTVKLRNKGVM